MSDLTSLVTAVASQVEEPDFDTITRRARTRRVRHVATTLTAVGLAAVVAVIAVGATSGSPRAVPATQQPSSVAATVRPPEQIVNGRNASVGRTWIAPERSGQLTVRAWAQCDDDTLTVTQCDPARRLGVWEVADAAGRRMLVPSGYDEGRVAYAGDGVWVLQPAWSTTPSLAPPVAASTSLSAPVTLALDPTRTIGMQAAKGRPHITCPDQPWNNCLVDLSAATLVPIVDLPTGDWAVTNAAGWWGVLETGQAVVEQPDGTLLRPDLYELVASPTRVFAEDARDGTIGWYLSSEEEVLTTTPVTALLSTDRGRTWTLRSVPATAEAAREWVTELEHDPFVLRAALPDNWRTWPVIDRS
jgi:hypothetical protein